MTRISFLSIHLAALALLVGCSPKAPGPTLPDHTVLVVSGVPITSTEVDFVADRLTPLGTTFTLPHRRRLALLNTIFPLISARRLGGESRVQAQREAEEFYRDQVEGRRQGPSSPPERGNWKALGLEVWLRLCDLEADEWSYLFEVPGAFVVARLLERDGNERADSEQFSADIARFPYLDSRSDIDLAVYTESLEIIDPAWEQIIPASWKLEMTGGS